MKPVKFGFLNGSVGASVKQIQKLESEYTANRKINSTGGRMKRPESVLMQKMELSYKGNGNHNYNIAVFDIPKNAISGTEHTFVIEKWNRSGQRIGGITIYIKVK